jgi:hypothetical protein
MKKMIIILAFLLAITEADAQIINFSGKWKLDKTKTGMPNYPELAFDISQSSTELSWLVYAPRPSGDTIVIKRVMPLNGSEIAYTNNEGKQLPCSIKSTETGLEVNFQNEELRQGNKTIISMKEYWTLSDNRDTLKIIHWETWNEKTGKYPKPLVFNRFKENITTQTEKNQSQPTRILTRQQLIEDTRELVGYIESIHPDPYLYCGGKVEFHRKFQDILQHIPEEGMTKDEFNKLLSPLIASIKDVHTGIITTYEFNRESPGGLPLSFGSVEKVVYVKGVIKEDHRFLIGAKLLAVQGIPLETLKERLSQVTAIENEYAGLYSLSYYLGIKPYLNEIIPEWQDFSKITAEFELASGKKQTVNFNLPVEKKSLFITNTTTVELPTTDRSEFN